MMETVWRYIEPGKPSALEWAQSTQAKCASSAMIHLGRRRNSNEYCGAYGHDFTFEEMKWLTYKPHNMKNSALQMLMSANLS